MPNTARVDEARNDDDKPSSKFETVLTLSDDACDDDRRRALLNALCPCIRPSPASSTSPEEMRGGVR